MYCERVKVVSDLFFLERWEEVFFEGYNVGFGF